MWRIPLTLNIFCLLLQSLWLRTSKAQSGVRLPPVEKQMISLHKADKIVHWFDIIASTLMPHNQHICFYRSFTLASLLRKRGIPVIMNVGGRGLGLNEVRKAHCWLTLDDQLYHEKENALALYPLEMGYNQNRSIRYWIGPELQERALNGEHVTRNRSIKPLFRRTKGL